MSVINEFLATIIRFIYGIVNNYGVAIILFTILIKGLLSPFDLKSRRSMRKMNAVNPKIKELQAKYANDQEKLNQKTMELYKAEKISPMAGCLPMLLTMPILFAMFTAMRMVANDQLVSQFLQMIHGVEPATEPFLWIRNLWMPDNFAKSIMPDYDSLRAITDMNVWMRISAQLISDGLLGAETLLNFADADAFQAYMATIPDLIAQSPAYVHYLETIPQLTGINVIFFSFSIFKNMNGYYILPILSVVTQLLITKLPGSQTANNSNAAAGANGQAASTGKMMMLMMPVMSLLFTTTSSSAFALYWVTSNIVAGVQQVAFHKYFEWQDRKSAVAQEVGIQ